MDYLGAWEGIRDMGSWFSEQDVESFSKLKLPKKPTIVELGTGLGKSTKAIRLLWPDARIVSCDPGYQGDPHLMSELDVDFRSDHGYMMDWYEPIDFLFIDDDHEEKTARLDIQKFKPYVKKGGYIICHDYYGTGVEKAVNALLPDATPIYTGEFSQAVWRNE